MSFQSYIDNVKAKTGKTPEDFAKLAAGRGLTRHIETVGFLKKEFALVHGHATAVAGVILKAGVPKASPEQKLDTLFGGKKQHCRKPAENLMRRFLGSAAM
jgi:hypothetical protein